MSQRSVHIALAAVTLLGGLGVAGYRATTVRDSLPMSTEDYETLTPELARELGAAIRAAAPRALDRAQSAPAEVEFALRNETGRDIFVQIAALAGQAYWGLSRDGRRIQAEHDCAVCVCDQPCEVCGRQLATVARVAAGAVHTWKWGGAQWTLSSGPEGACERRSAVAPGALDLTVVYGFGTVAESQFGANDTFVADTRSVSGTFAYPGTGTFELLARLPPEAASGVPPAAR